MLAAASFRAVRLSKTGIANAAAFLASDLGRMITGVVLPVDAGLTAGNPVLASELTLEPF